MKDVRKLYQSVLALSLLTAPISTVAFADTPSTSTTVSPQSNVTVTIDGNVQNYDPAPEIVNGRTLVPLRGIFEALGAKVDWDAASQTVIATKGTDSIKAQIGNYFAEKDGFTVQLDVKPQLINGRTMIPIRFVSEALGAAVRWHPESNTVAIYTNVNSQSASSQNANGQISGTQLLTYQQALDMAMKNSISLKNAQANIDRSQEVRDNAADNLDYTPIGAGSDSSDSAERSALLGLTSADTSLQNAKKQYDVTEDSIAYSVKKSYYEILQDIEKKKLDDLTLDNATTQLQLVTVKNQNGLASDYDLTQAQSAVDTAKAKQQSAQKTLDDANQKFDNLLGLSVDTHYNLEDQPTYEELGNIDLNAHIQSILATNPSIWLKEQQVKQAQMGVDLYTFNNSGSDPYKAKEIDVTTAKNSLDDAKNQLDQSLRTTYYSIKQSEDQYNILKSSLDTANQAMKIAQAKFDAGMAIKADLTSAQLNVEQLKQQLFDLTVQHELSVDAFNKPWAASGGSSSGSSSAGK
jgi:hypothetical protein